MYKRISQKYPEWLEKEPPPVLEERRFHDKKIHVWIGEVDIKHVEGWQGNPRIELIHDQFFEAYARHPTNEEMCELVLADDDEQGLKIKDLAANIRKNGIRVPVVLTNEGKLLDGNRRYYASMFLANEGTGKKGRKDFSRLPAYVLPKGTTEDVESAILTEFNFADHMQVPWPYYIRARTVYLDYDEHGIVDKNELQEKYGFPWKYLTKWISAARLCDRFLKQHGETFVAKQFAYRNFIMFDEMMRNYGARFKEVDFRESIFNVLLDGYEPESHKHHKFTKSQDVVRLDEIYDSADAWHALVNGRGSKALKEALGILEMSNLGGSSDPNPALKRVVKGLEKLANNRNLSSADPELLQTFHTYSQQVPGGPSDPASQIEQMVDWLEAITTGQIVELEKGSLARLQRALKLVLKLARSAKEV
jgi:hypothetical protein